ncbi:MAG: hypothetical protein PQJ47_04355 [Sphaerochaetaceae bacterium]|nr:hypothetical protein [Sphaerochaetaceae bacterium]
MNTSNYAEISELIRQHARKANRSDIDSIMKILSKGDLPVTRFVDFHLGRVTNPEGLKRIEHYLFKGDQIQRNYAALFFERRNEWKIVNEAYKLGLIDWVQAYSR